VTVYQENARARAAARHARRQFYMHQMVDLWPACVDCAQPIRHAAHVDRPGLYRSCGCDGRVWHFGANSWEIMQ
jgi:hypothetical protein